MEFSCYLCSKSLSFPKIQRSQKESPVIIDCSSCGSYAMDVGGETIIQNLKDNKMLHKNELEIVRDWIKNNIGKIITRNVLFQLIPRQIKLFEKKFKFKFSRGDITE